MLGGGAILLSSTLKRRCWESFFPAAFAAGGSNCVTHNDAASSSDDADDDAKEDDSDSEPLDFEVVESSVDSSSESSLDAANHSLSKVVTADGALLDNVSLDCGHVVLDRKAMFVNIVVGDVN